MTILTEGLIVPPAGIVKLALPNRLKVGQLIVAILSSTVASTVSKIDTSAVQVKLKLAKSRAPVPTPRVPIVVADVRVKV